MTASAESARIAQWRKRRRPRNDGDVLAAESDLDDFAHGGAVVNKIDDGRALFGSGGFRWYGGNGMVSFIATPWYA